MSEALHLLDADRIDARRRPRVILLAWLWELACGFVIAIPVHAWAARAWGGHPEGDAVFFRPGGHALLSWLDDVGPALGIVVQTTLIALFVAALVGRLVTGAVVGSLVMGEGEGDRAPSTSFALRVGASSFFGLLGIDVLAGAIQGFIVAIGLFASSATDHAFESSLGDARAFIARVVVFVLFVAAALVVGVAADLGRVGLAANVASGNVGESSLGTIKEGVLVGARTARRAIGRATFAWGWRTGLSLVLLYVGFRAGDVITGTWLLVVVHQVVALVRIAVRTSWLAKALRLARPALAPTP
jgi:hypothetical protein